MVEVDAEGTLLHQRLAIAVRHHHDAHVSAHCPLGASATDDLDRFAAAWPKLNEPMVLR